MAFVTHTVTGNEEFFVDTNVEEYDQAVIEIVGDFEGELIVRGGVSEAETTITILNLVKTYDLDLPYGLLTFEMRNYISGNPVVNLLLKKK